MARYLVLAFENNSHAETFAEDWIEAKKAMRERGEEGFPRLLTPVQENDVECELIAMTLKPSLFCDNSDGHRTGKTASGWTKGKKWGLWICARCGKPSLRWGGSYQAVLGAAKNLLQPDTPHPRALTQEERATVAAGGNIMNNPPPGYNQDL